MLKKCRNLVIKSCFISLACLCLVLVTLLMMAYNDMICDGDKCLPSISSIQSSYFISDEIRAPGRLRDADAYFSMSKMAPELRDKNGAKYRSPLLSSPNNTVLRAEIQLIVDAAIDAFFTESTTSPDVPSCKGHIQKGEVEDIFCIPRPKFLPGVKNPCWLDDYLSPYEKKLSETRPWSVPLVGNRVLRCLPYFHILGCEKCGSSDLWKRLVLHPDMSLISGTMQKEANWWAWGRYGFYSYKTRPIRPFLQYTKAFINVTTKIAGSLNSNNTKYKDFITGDGTPSDMMDFRGWPNIVQNRGLASPQVITPHLMRHMYPNPKFIILFRNPIDRLISDYFFINSTWLKKSPEDLHNRLLESIHIMANCVRHRTLRQCSFDPTMYRALPLRLHYVFYSLFVPEWFKLYPKDNFLIFKTEEYAKNVNGTVKACMDFLGLEPLSEKAMKKISTQKRYLVKSKKEGADTVLPQTRRIIEDLAIPSMRMFADMMGDERFNWEADKSSS